MDDLLYDAPPESLLRPLASARGSVLLLAPWLQEEQNPGWTGNLELLDCESRVLRRQRVDEFLLQRYQHAYRRHFDSWRAETRRHDARLARVPADLPSLPDALLAEALPNGIVEPNQS